MKPMRKFLISIELIICFTPAVIVLFIGIPIIPNAISFIAQGNSSWITPLAIQLGGLIGLVGVSIISYSVLNSAKFPVNKFVIQLLLLSGVMSTVAALYVNFVPNLVVFVYILPFVAICHLAYMGRNELFGS